MRALSKSLNPEPIDEKVQPPPEIKTDSPKPKDAGMCFISIKNAAVEIIKCSLYYRST